MYGTIAQADAYYSSVNFSNWGLLSDEQKTVALTTGSNILDALYTHRFPGQKTGGFQQVNQWPRTNAKTRFGEDIPADVVPTSLEIAAYVITIQEVSNPGSLLAVSFSSQQVKRQKLDVLEREFFKNDAVDQYGHLPFLPVVEGMLYDILISNLPDFPVYWVR